MANARVISGNRGLNSKVLVHDGFKYYLNNSRNNTMYWRCWQRKHVVLNMYRNMSITQHESKYKHLTHRFLENLVFLEDLGFLRENPVFL